MRSIAIVKSQSDSDVSWHTAAMPMPALLQRTSRRPQRATAPSITRCISEARATSAVSATATPPDATIEEATRDAPLASRSTTTTRPPSWANARAIASPIPDPPPVISTTLSTNRRLTVTALMVPIPHRACDQTRGAKRTQVYARTSFGVGRRREVSKGSLPRPVLRVRGARATVRIRRSPRLQAGNSH